MENDKIEKFPQSKATEIANVGAQSAAGIVPLAGGALAPIVAAIVSAPLERRRTEWFNRIAEGLNQLKDQFAGFDPEDLASNDDFVSAVYTTTDAAMRASRESKRERLANVALNVAAGKTINEALRERFIGLVQMFSEEHILVLRMGRDPQSYPRMVDRVKDMMAGGRGGVYMVELAHHGVSEAVFGLIASDLEREGLIQGGFNVTMTAQGILNPITTDRGNAFLEFIRSPIDSGGGSSPSRSA